MIGHLLGALAFAIIINRMVCRRRAEEREHQCRAQRHQRIYRTSVTRITRA